MCYYYFIFFSFGLVLLFDRILLFINPYRGQTQMWQSSRYKHKKEFLSPNVLCYVGIYKKPSWRHFRLDCWLQQTTRDLKKKEKKGLGEFTRQEVSIWREKAFHPTFTPPFSSWRYSTNQSYWPGPYWMIECALLLPLSHPLLCTAPRGHRCWWWVPAAGVFLWP